MDNSDELNRKISYARQLIGPTGLIQFDERDWTGSEEASAILFDEIIAEAQAVYFETRSEAFMSAVRLITSNSPDNKDRKRSIAETWLRLKTDPL